MTQITKPSLAVATEAYQLLLELCRMYPEDPDLPRYKAQAYSLMDGLWHEYHDPVITRAQLSEFL